MCGRRWHKSATLISSTPGAPLLRRTCASAFRTLSRSTTAFIDGPTAAGFSVTGAAARASVLPGAAVRASPFPSDPKASSSWIFCRLTRSRLSFLFTASNVRAFGRLAPLRLCPLLTPAPRSRTLRCPQSRFRDTTQASRGKFNRLPRMPAGFTVPALDGCGLCGSRPARPAGSASYPVSVRQAAGLLHAASRPRLAATPLRFANPSPPSGWIKDLHLQAVEHARHTVDGRDMCGWPPARKDFSACLQRRPIAVMCPAWWRGTWPQALMGSVDRGLIKPAGSRCLMSRDRYPSIRRSTDDAITLLHPRKSCVSQVLFLCSIRGPFLRPDLVSGWRRAPPRSRLAEGHRRRRARSGLDGGKHGAKLARVGARLIVAPAAEILLAYHHRPTDARHLIGERAGGDLALLGLEQFDQPGVLLGSLAAQHRHRAVDQQAAQITVATLADRPELDLSSRAVLPRHQTERGGEVPSAGKGGGVDGERRHGAGQDRSVAGDGDQVPAGLVVAAPTDNLLLDDLDPSLEPAQGLHDRQQALVQRARYTLVCRIGQDRHQLADMMGTFGDHDAKLRHQPAQRVDQHGALLDQHLTHLVNARRRLLHLGLDRDKAHRWPAHRLADRLGIRRVVLVAPDIGLGIGRWDQPHVVAQLGDLARPIMRRRTRLHPDQTGRQLGKERQNLPATHRTTEGHHARSINPVHLKHCFGQIQPDRCNLFHGWLPSVGVVDNPTLAHRCREGAIHPIKPGQGALGCKVRWKTPTRAARQFSPDSPAHCGRGGTQPAGLGV